MKEDLIVCSGPDELATRATAFIVGVLAGAVRSRGRATIALSGGSTPKPVYSRLALPQSRGLVDWSKTLVFFSDERFVPLDDPSSNFGLAKQALLEGVPIPSSQVFAVPTMLDSADAAAKAYEATLKDVFGYSRVEDPPHFDLIVLGLGQDGHTASLFPGFQSLSVTNRWVVASPPGSLPPPVDRVTFTFPLLNAAKNVLFLVSGREKAHVLHRVRERGPGPESLPASKVHPTPGTLTWIVDKAAASG